MPSTLPFPHMAPKARPRQHILPLFSLLDSSWELDQTASFWELQVNPLVLVFAGSWGHLHTVAQQPQPLLQLHRKLHGPVGSMTLGRFISVTDSPAQGFNGSVS